MGAAVTLVALLSIAVAMLPASASAQQRAHRSSRPSTVLATTVSPNSPILERESESRSIGVPDRGRLRAPVELVSTPHLAAREGTRRTSYGTAELVGLLTRAAAAVGASGTGPRLVVGDLSAPAGGRLRPHRSHRSGRDADIGFYVVDGEGRPVEPPHFVQIRRSGCGQIRGVEYCFDAARNWALAAAMVSDPRARVQYLLVAPDLRRRILEEGQRQGAPADLIERVSLATEPHSGSHSHRSHFHVRVYCAVDDRPECVDEPPYHPWYDGEPSPQRHEVSARRVRERRVVQARRARIRARAVARRRERNAANQ